MTSFFGELGKKLAEKWLSLLVLPGLLLLVTAAVGGTLGHRRPFDWERLVDQADQWAKALGARPAVAQIGVLAVVVLGSVGVGLTVRALSGVTRRVWSGDWFPTAGWFTKRRINRWVRADPLRRNAISRAKPARPTWMGDQLAAVDARLFNQYEVDLRAWWPRLWMVLDDSTRAELRAARAAFDDAAAQATWALGYVLLAAFWWPAVVIAVAVWIAGWTRGRAAIGGYADLIEATVDTNAVVLAKRLGHGQFNRTVGDALTAEFRKGA